MKILHPKEQALAARRVRRITRTLAAGFLLALFFAAGCRRPPDGVAGHLTGETGWMNEAQAGRIEAQLAHLSNERDIPLFVQVREGPPSAAPAPRQEGWALELYPLPREARLIPPLQGEPALPEEWQKRLLQQLRAALPDGGRAGDVLEILLEELAKQPVADATPPQTAASEPAPPAPPVKRIFREKFPGLDLGGTDFMKAQADPERTYLAYLLAAKKRDTRSDLALYTPESRFFFKKHPVTADQLKRVEEKYVGAPYELAVQGERAVIHFPSLDLTYAPVFLQKTEAGWQLDFFAVSKTIRTSVQKLWRFEKPEESPYRFAFERYFIDEAGYVIYRQRAQ